MVKLDLTWLREHPLPPVDGGDKNARGRVLVVGGAEFVPGALRLTGEAALRAGAGKVQLATVRAAAMSLGVLVPDAAIIALPPDDEGEIAADAAKLLVEHVETCDALVLGPGMSEGERTDDLVAALLEAATARQTVILDAAAITSANNLQKLIKLLAGRVILTPHHGEMAHLTGLTRDTVANDIVAIGKGVADEFGAVVVLKGVQTVIAVPNGPPMLFSGGNAGLATGGSGDVLAGLIGGIAARGAAPQAAAGWGVCAHGEAGAQAAKQIAPVGYLARDLLPLIPGVLANIVGEATPETRG
jgi:ADP-dependent NAD(P)H-hydrate dehydratase